MVRAKLAWYLALASMEDGGPYNCDCLDAWICLWQLQRSHLAQVTLEPSRDASSRERPKRHSTAHPWLPASPH